MLASYWDADRQACRVDHAHAGGGHRQRAIPTPGTGATRGLSRHSAPRSSQQAWLAAPVIGVSPGLAYKTKACMEEQ
jgi:hypothetical protein